MSLAGGVNEGLPDGLFRFRLVGRDPDQIRSQGIPRITTTIHNASGHSFPHTNACQHGMFGVSCDARTWALGGRIVPAHTCPKARSRLRTLSPTTTLFWVWTTM